MPRRRQWFDFIINDTITNGRLFTQTLLTGDVDETKGMTLVRTIVSLDVVADPLMAVSGVQRVAFGIGIASQDALAVGGVSLANPTVETDKPMTGWIWRDMRAVVDDPVPGYPWPHLAVDIRSARKVMYGAPFLRIANNANQGTAFSVEVIGMVRCLFLLE